jgi:mannose-6-phosphate isomerase-like protein (cupin superfamily)
MERRKFLLNAGIFSAFAGVTQNSFATLNIEDKSNLQPFLLPATAPLEHNDGMAVKVWVRSAMTGGIYSNIECAVAPKKMGPPPHWHIALDELMYVAEGTASILIGDDVVEVQAGGWHLRPRGLQHTFWNASDKPLRFYDMYFNQPFEEYLEQIFHKLTEENGYKEGSELKNNAIKKLNDDFGLVFNADAFDKYNEIKKKYDLT